MIEAQIWKQLRRFCSKIIKFGEVQMCHSRNVHALGPPNATDPPDKTKVIPPKRIVRPLNWLDVSERGQLLEVSGKVAIIAGGCTGVCLATARELLRHDAKHIVLTGKEPADGYDALREINREFVPNRASRVEYVHLDVTNSQEFEEVFRQTLHKHQHIDMLFNVSGMMDDSRWEYEVDTNINGMVRGILLAFRYMGHRTVNLPPLEALSRVPNPNAGLPVVVNMACVVGLDPLAGAPVYSLTQSAAVALTRCFGAPFHATRTGVRVLCLYTGITSEDALLDDDKYLRLKLLNWEWSAAAQEQVKKMPVQEVRAAAQAALFLVRYAPSGSVWVVEDSELSRLNIPSRKDLCQPAASFKT